jgi:hypothetical protein
MCLAYIIYIIDRNIPWDIFLRSIPPLFACQHKVNFLPHTIARCVGVFGRMDSIHIVHKRKTNELHNRDGQRSQKEETKSGGVNQVDQ